MFCSCNSVPMLMETNYIILLINDQLNGKTLAQRDLSFGTLKGIIQMTTVNVSCKVKPLTNPKLFQDTVKSSV